MRPLFTIHAGEFLVGEYIEHRFRNTNVWLPSKDTGVDLLVTNKNNSKSVSLQVKYSRDFVVTNLSAEFQESIRSFGWWTFDAEKLRSSTADYWVLLIVGFSHRSNDHIIIKPKELYKLLRNLHPKVKKFQTYIWVTQKDKCWETRDLIQEEKRQVASDDYNNISRDLSPFLNAWMPLQNLDEI